MMYTIQEQIEKVRALLKEGGEIVFHDKGENGNAENCNGWLTS